jgi:hypothetical protein
MSDAVYKKCQLCGSTQTSSICVICGCGTVLKTEEKMSDAVEIMLKAMAKTKKSMELTAEKMEFAANDFLGTDSMDHLYNRAGELRGAAGIMQTWIDGIRNETKKGG